MSQFYQKEHLPESHTPLQPNRPDNVGESDSADDFVDVNARNDTWSIVLIGAVTFCAVFLVVLGLLIQIFVVHAFHVTSDSVVTTAPLGPTLAIAHACSVVVSMTAPLVIGLCAYKFAGSWLASSNEGGENRPTPYQLGTLMTIFNGANLAALWKSSTYMFGVSSTPGGKALRRPPILRNAALFLFFMLSLMYAAAGIETWLGVSSDAAVYPLKTKYEDSKPLFGRRINQTLCDEWNSSGNPYLCGLIRGSGGNPQASAQIILAYNGISVSNAIVLTDDHTAIIVPPKSTISQNVEYVATTFGVKSSCNSVTHLCVNLGNPGPDAGLNVSCQPSVMLNRTSSCDSGNSAQPCVILDDQGQYVNSVNSSEFRIGVVVESFAYNDPKWTSDQFAGDTGFFLHGNHGGYNVLVCQIEILTVTYGYSNGSYTALQKSPADLDQARRVAFGIGSYDPDVVNAVDGAGLYSGSYSDSFGNELSRYALSRTSYVYDTAEVLEVNNVLTNIGSKLKLVPFLLLLVVLGIYCLIALVITILAVIESRSSPHASLARNRLIDPLTAINSAYGAENSKMNWSSSTTELFGHETDADRLNVGAIHRNDGHLSFGVVKAPVDLTYHEYQPESYSSLRTSSPRALDSHPMTSQSS